MRPWTNAGGVGAAMGEVAAMATLAQPSITRSRVAADELLTLGEAAAYLGIDAGWLRALIRHRRIPACHLHRRLLVWRGSLDAWRQGQAARK